MFDQPIPSFNLKGKAGVQTSLGGTLTFLIMLIMLLYAALKFIQLIEKDNPTVAESHIDSYYSPQDHLNLTDIDFRVAFTIEGVFESESKIDPRYTKILILYRGKSNGEEIETSLGFHNCTEEDWQYFPEPSQTSASQF